MDCFVKESLDQVEFVLVEIIEWSERKKRTLNFVCVECGVEFVDSRIRRSKMGYIKLACPVTHVWYLKRLPSYIANLLDKPRIRRPSILRCVIWSKFAFYRFALLNCHPIQSDWDAPDSDMVLGRSNMKLRILGVFNIPKWRGNWSMVNSVTAK